MPGTALGIWRVESERRRRDASTTYRVICTPSGETAAMTVFDTPALQLGSYARRLLGVAHILSAVEHPGVASVIDVGLTADGRPFVVTDPDEGITLTERCSAAKVAFEDALVILRGICAPLMAAHEVGVVHGSLTADRIVLVEGDDRFIHVLDWGLERAVFDEARRAGIERTGIQECTAPEASLGLVSPQLDVYAFGVIAYELVLGRPPFVAESTEELRQLQEEGPPDPREIWTEIPVALDALLRALLATDPRNRPTIRGVAERLASIEHECAAPPAAPPVHAYMVPPDVPPDTYPQSRSYAPLWAVAATALAVAVGIAAPSLVDPEESQVRTVASLSLKAAPPARTLPRLAPAAAPAQRPVVVPAVASAAVAPVTARSVPTPEVAVVSIVAVPRRAPPAAAATRAVASPAPRRSTAATPVPVRREPAAGRASSEVGDRMDEIKAELLTRYQRIGRDLIQLRRQRNNAATAEMWHQFKGLEIHHSLATAKTRATASATLDELRAKIERNKSVEVSAACKESPLADGCLAGN